MSLWTTPRCAAAPARRRSRTCPRSSRRTRLGMPGWPRAAPRTPRGPAARLTQWRLPRSARLARPGRTGTGKGLTKGGRTVTQRRTYTITVIMVCPTMRARTVRLAAFAAGSSARWATVTPGLTRGRTVRCEAAAGRGRVLRRPRRYALPPVRRLQLQREARMPHLRPVRADLLGRADGRGPRPSARPMTWVAAMRWALLRARETGIKRKVYAYPVPVVPDGCGRQNGWAYAVGKSDEDGCE